VQVAGDPVQKIEQLEVLGRFEQHDRTDAIEDRTRAAQRAQLPGDPRGFAAPVQFAAGAVAQCQVRDCAPADGMRKVLEQPDAGRQLIYEREDVRELGGVQRPAAALVSLRSRRRAPGA
jgi:hypothetical protein